MIKKIFTVCLSVLGYISFGQAITISEELPLRNEYNYTILGWMSGDLLLLRDKGHEFYVQSFDDDLHLKWEREISLGPEKTDLIGVVSHNDRIHILFGMREKGSYYIEHRSFDHTIAPIDTMMMDSIEENYLSPSFGMAKSEDESKVMIYREENSNLKMISYDLDNREVISMFTLKLGGANMERDYRTMEVTNAGDFYLTLIPDRDQQKIHTLEVFSNIPGDDKIRREVIEMEDQQVYDYYTQYDNLHDDLVITGLYSEHNVSRAQGIYFVRYEAGVDHTIHYLPFDDALIAEVNGKEVSESKGLSDFNVQKVALRRDGGVVVIAELNKEFSRRSSLPVHRDNGTFDHGGWVDYYYEDLILMGINPDGSLHWKKVLRKRQYSQDDDAMYSSFFLFKTSSRLRFLFNDEIKQENTVGGYEVTGSGYAERKTVFNTDYQRLKLRFKDGLQVAYNECIVPSERNNKLNLVRIKY